MRGTRPWRALATWYFPGIRGFTWPSRVRLAPGRCGGYKSGMSAESGPGAAPGAEPDRPAATASAGAAPRHIVVAGDWHGNEGWALSVIGRVPSLLAGEPRRLILHLGDFGIWPDAAGRAYLAHVSAALAAVDAELWFVDGNHEDFPLLGRLAREGGATPDGREVIGAPLVSPAPRLPVEAGTTGAGWPAAAGSAWTGRCAPRAWTGGRRRRSPPPRKPRSSPAAPPTSWPATTAPPASRIPSAARRPEWDPADLARNDAHRRRAAAHHRRRPARPRHARAPAPRLPAAV